MKVWRDEGAVCGGYDVRKMWFEEVVRVKCDVRRVKCERGVRKV
jgi:hypothetical protein